MLCFFSLFPITEACVGLVCDLVMWYSFNIKELKLYILINFTFSMPCLDVLGCGFVAFMDEINIFGTIHSLTLVLLDILE